MASDHTRIDERSLALHRRVAEKIRANPALLDKARTNLRRWQAMNPVASVALSEWEHILDGDVDAIAALLVERSERATRLRQSSPFTDILDETERREIYESHPARTHHPRRQRNLRR